MLVTGGTRGIGAAIADAFAAQGDTVAVCGRRPPETESHAFFAADLREPEACEALVMAVVERFGRLDVLVNNAGGSPPADAATMSPRFSDKIIKLNLMAPLWLSQQANAVMQGQEAGGVIVNIASVSGVRASPGTAAYGAAKAGLLSLTKSLAVEWAPKVRVVAVTPGLVATEWAVEHYPNFDAIAATVPLGRFGSPEDVAKATVFLASDGAAYASGTNLVLDGGGEWPAFLRVQG
ncbi:MAG: SDR family oxidoreductase [Deltaproteobacteria bacterium]|nr:MAG: SDR family oxidoreductase [Deltaproteobacteria bacterium]